MAFGFLHHLPTILSRCCSNASIAKLQGLGNKVDRALANVELSLEEAHVNLVEMQQMTAEVLKKLEEEGLHQAVRSTTTTLEEIPPPTLEDFKVSKEPS